MREKEEKKNKYFAPRNSVNIFSTPNGVPFGGDLQVGISSSNLKRFNGMKIGTGYVEWEWHMIFSIKPNCSLQQSSCPKH